MGIVSRVRASLLDSASYLRASPVRLLAVGGALAAGSLAGIPVGDEIYTYQWADYRFCNDCHVHDYANEAYERSVHFGMTTCHDCHLVPIRHYPRNLWVTVFSPPQSPDDIHPPDVENVICTRCHSAQTDDDPLTGPMPQEVREIVVKIDDSPMHLVHMQSKTRDPGLYRGGGHGDGGTGGHGAAPGAAAPTEHGDAAAPEAGHGGVHGITADWDAGVITCMDCHGAESNRAHAFEASTANCVACHEGVAPEGSPIAQLECRECHFAGFMGTTRPLAAAEQAAPSGP